MERPQVFNTGPLPFFCVEKAGKIAVFHTGKSCCSWVRREQTPPVSLRSTDSPFCRCAPSAPLFVTYGDISPRRGENLSRPGEVVLWDGAFGSTEKFPAKVQSLRHARGSLPEGAGKTDRFCLREFPQQPRKNKPSRADKVPERAYKTMFYALAAARTRGMQRRRGQLGFFSKQRYTAA